MIKTYTWTGDGTNSGQKIWGIGDAGYIPQLVWVYYTTYTNTLTLYYPNVFPCATKNTSRTVIDLGYQIWKEDSQTNTRTTAGVLALQVKVNQNYAITYGYSMGSAAAMFNEASKNYICGILYKKLL